MIGRGYVIDHCVSLFNKKVEEKNYRRYVSETLRLIGENVAKLSGGSYIKASYSELSEVNNESEKSGDEIALDIIRRSGLKIKGQS